jgi:hypothetical protein
MRLLITAGCLMILQAAHAQWTLVPLPRTAEPEPTFKAAARTKSTLDLPFWDDFSNDLSSTPSSDIWFAGRSAWINSGLAINPPSINVASFDGIDSLGKPYSVNDVLAKGFADKLESQPIDLSKVTAAEQSTVFFSFYYQLKGRGELPDAGDRLILEFKNVTGGWEQVWTAENNGTLATDVFTQAVVPVTGEKFFHAGFRFRFKNFARLSGPYDTWHLDYIYLNKGRSIADTSYPDRSVVAPLTSIFKTYRAIPKTHFFVDKTAAMTKPSIVVHNLRADNNQPLNYFSYARIGEYNGTTISEGPLTLMDSAAAIGSVNSLEYKTAEVALQDLPALLDETADSLHVVVKVGLSTKDNLPLSENGDYEQKFAPIDFRDNDTTRADYWISSYYAYDDGTAEYGAALNQSGAQVAYKYSLVGETEGFIRAVQMYFPKFGDESSQVIELRIWNDLNETESSVLYSEVVTLQRTGSNNFWIKKLNKAVKVGEQFYIGWKQSSSAVIAVGFDKNTNSGDKIHFNISGAWETNQLLAGSLMMRPVFGEASEDPGTDPDPINGLEEEAVAGLAPYPNPTDGRFVIPGHITDLMIRDLSGRSIAFSASEGPSETNVAITGAQPGILVLLYMRDGYPKVGKLMVR